MNQQIRFGFKDSGKFLKDLDPRALSLTINHRPLIDGNFRGTEALSYE